MEDVLDLYAEPYACGLPRPPPSCRREGTAAGKAWEAEAYEYQRGGREPVPHL